MNMVHYANGLVITVLWIIRRFKTVLTFITPGSPLYRPNVHNKKPFIMKQQSLYTLLVLIFLTLSGCFGTGEPSEKEMREAYQVKIDVINANLESFKNERLDKNNPLTALRRLTGEIMGDARIKFPISKSWVLRPRKVNLAIFAILLQSLKLRVK